MATLGTPNVFVPASEEIAREKAGSYSTHSRRAEGFTCRKLSLLIE
jgi:hypothetical protein